MTIVTGPNNPKVLIGKIDVSDMIREIAKRDPLREIPEVKRLLDLTLEEYDKEMGVEPEE
jgi:hypothetical protein